MSARIRAVVFDMDGVLVDAKEWHYDALNRALRLFGYTIDRYDHLVTFDGLPTRKKLEILSQDRGLPTALHPFLNELKQRYTEQIVHVHCKPLFQHEFALSRLRADGYRLCVASNSVRKTVELVVEKTCLGRYFDLLLSNEDVRNPKPDPEIYETAFARLGVAPHECLIVEDHPNGVRAARSSGAHVLVVDGVAAVTYDNVLSRIRAAELGDDHRNSGGIVAVEGTQ